MQIQLTESAYSSSFHNTIHSWDRYLIEWGGRGSGKTDSLYMKYLLELFQPYYFKQAYVNKEQSNIRQQQYAGFKRVAKRIGLYDHLRFYETDMVIRNPKNDNCLIPRGMDDPEKTKGLDDITCIWWDEINKGSRDDFSALNELLRTPQAQYLQFALSFNPVSESHWLRGMFFHPDDRFKVHPDFKSSTYLHHSTFRDNEFIDQEAYYQTLFLAASGDKNKIRVNIEGDWGLEENGNPWLFNFDEDNHVGSCPFLPTYPVYLSFDFNRDPVTCTAYQMSPNAPLGVSDSFVHCIKEFAEPIQLHELCKRIKSVYPSSIFYVTGDRTGKSGDVGFEQRNMSYYSIIQSQFRLSDKQMHIDGKNMEHNDSRALMNTLLYHHPNFKIDHNCKHLIDECHKATVDEKKQKAGVLKKDRDIYKMDLFDGFRYFGQTYFDEYTSKLMQL